LGAHPTSFPPNYGYDSRFHRDWIEISRDTEKAAEFLQRYVRNPGTQKEYLEAVGGKPVLDRIKKWEESR